MNYIKKLTKVNKLDKLHTVKKKYLLKMFLKNGEMVKYTSRDTTKRISSIIVRNNFEKAYLKVSYGKAVCSKGCYCEFYNDGWYTDKEVLLLSWNSFRKEEL